MADPCGGQPPKKQVESELAASMRDVVSSKKSWMALGFGCFALGVACACLLLPSASHADSLHTPAHQGLAYAPMVMPLRSNRPSSFLPQIKPTSTATKAHKPYGAYPPYGDFAMPDASSPPAATQSAFTPAANAPAASSLKAVSQPYGVYPPYGDFARPEDPPAAPQSASTLAANAPAPASSLKAVPSMRSDGEWEMLESHGGHDPEKHPRIIISEDIACPVDEDLKACLEAAFSPTISEEIECPVDEDPKACVQAAAAAQAGAVAPAANAHKAPASAPKNNDQASIQAWHASRPQSGPAPLEFLFDQHAPRPQYAPAALEFLFDHPNALAEGSYVGSPAAMAARSRDSTTITRPAAQPKPASSPKLEAKKRPAAQEPEMRPVAQDAAVAPAVTAAPAPSYKAAMAANPPREKQEPAVKPPAQASHAFDDAFDAIAADHIAKLDKESSQQPVEGKSSSSS